MSHYKLLQIERTASNDDIRAAYKEQVLQAHPDKGGSAQMFKRLQDAYECLRDPAKRKEYDDKLRDLAAVKRYVKSNAYPAPLASVKCPNNFPLMNGDMYTFETAVDRLKSRFRPGDVVCNKKDETGCIIGLAGNGIYWRKDGDAFASLLFTPGGFCGDEGITLLFKNAASLNNTLNGTFSGSFTARGSSMGPTTPGRTPRSTQQLPTDLNTSTSSATARSTTPPPATARSSISTPPPAAAASSSSTATSAAATPNPSVRTTFSKRTSVQQPAASASTSSASATTPARTMSRSPNPGAPAASPSATTRKPAVPTVGRAVRATSPSTNKHADPNDVSTSSASLLGASTSDGGAAPQTARRSVSSSALGSGAGSSAVSAAAQQRRETLRAARLAQINTSIKATQQLEVDKRAEIDREVGQHFEAFFKGLETWRARPSVHPRTVMPFSCALRCFSAVDKLTVAAASSSAAQRRDHSANPSGSATTPARTMRSVSNSAVTPRATSSSTVAGATVAPPTRSSNLLAPTASSSSRTLSSGRVGTATSGAAQPRTPSRQPTTTASRSLSSQNTGRSPAGPSATPRSTRTATTTTTTTGASTATSFSRNDRSAPRPTTATASSTIRTPMAAAAVTPARTSIANRTTSPGAGNGKAPLTSVATASNRTTFSARSSICTTPSTMVTPKDGGLQPPSSPPPPAAGSDAQLSAVNSLNVASSGRASGLRLGTLAPKAATPSRTAPTTAATTTTTTPAKATTTTTPSRVDHLTNAHGGTSPSNSSLNDGAGGNDSISSRPRQFNFAFGKRASTSMMREEDNTSDGGNVTGVSSFVEDGPIRTPANEEVVEEQKCTIAAEQQPVEGDEAADDVPIESFTKEDLLAYYLPSRTRAMAAMPCDDDDDAAAAEERTTLAMPVDDDDGDDTVGAAASAAATPAATAPQPAIRSTFSLRAPRASADSEATATNSRAYRSISLAGLKSAAPTGGAAAAPSLAAPLPMVPPPIIASRRSGGASAAAAAY